MPYKVIVVGRHWVETLGVRSAPTLLVIKKEEVIDKVDGPWKDALKEAIEKHIN